MPDDDTPERKRIVGAARAHQLEARRHLGELAKGRARGELMAPPAPEPHPGDWDELSEVTRAAVAQGVADGVARARQTTTPDSDPSALSVHVPILGRLSARGRVVWAVVILGAALVALWLVLR